jgi:hypothetical protein
MNCSFFSRLLGPVQAALATRLLTMGKCFYPWQREGAVQESCEEYGNTTSNPSS